MSRLPRLSALAFVVAFLGLAASAAAHDVGVWSTELTERADGTIHARVSLVATEAPLAMDHDAHLAMELHTDDAKCAPGAVTTTPDGDGAILDEDFACQRATQSIDVVEYFKTEDVITLTTEEGLHQELLDNSHRAMHVELRRAHVAKRASRAPWFVGGAIAAVALIAIAIQRILGRRS